MKIFVTQRDGTRYFTRFADLGERDKLEVELKLEDKNSRIVTIDLTSALVEEYSKHPEIGKVGSTTVAEIVSLRPVMPRSTRKSKAVSPAYLSESKQQKDELVARVREAQLKAVEERKQKQAQRAANARNAAAARRATLKDVEEASAVKRLKSTKTAKPTATTQKKTTAANAARPKPLPAADKKTTSKRTAPARVAEKTKTPEPKTASTAGKRSSVPQVA